MIKLRYQQPSLWNRGLAEEYRGLVGAVDAVLEREVRANLVYRAFTRIGDEKVPDAKTLARLGQVRWPEVIQQLHERAVKVAQERGAGGGNCG